MIFAYADPPYVGCAHRYPEKREVDHAELIARLVADYPDGWALSCHSPSLRMLLPLCPEDVRVGAWVKPFAVFKPNVNPAYAWEPIIWRGGRARTRLEPTVVDWIRGNITLQRGLPGVKPDAFAYWIFGLLNMRSGDTLHDLFPGTGAVTKAWESWQRQRRMFVTGRVEER